MVEQLREAKTPKEAWYAFKAYFHKMKTLCYEIFKLDPEAAIAEAKMRRIIIHGLNLRYRGFVTIVQSWPTQTSLLDFENLLADQKTIAKEISRDSLKCEEDTLFANKNKERPWPNIDNGSKETMTNQVVVMEVLTQEELK